MCAEDVQLRGCIQSLRQTDLTFHFHSVYLWRKSTTRYSDGTNQPLNSKKVTAPTRNIAEIGTSHYAWILIGAHCAIRLNALTWPTGLAERAFYCSKNHRRQYLILQNTLIVLFIDIVGTVCLWCFPGGRYCAPSNKKNYLKFCGKISFGFAMELHDSRSLSGKNHSAKPKCHSVFGAQKKVWLKI